MSSSVLQKSLKLFEEGDKAPKSGILKTLKKTSKKKRQKVVNSDKKEELVKQNVQNNLKALQLLNHYSVSKEVSQKIIKHVTKADITLADRQFEEGTVFTEEDFAAFEKEYEID